MAVETLTSIEVEEAVTALPAFEEWRIAHEYIEGALVATPRHIDVENALHLRAQLALVEAREAIQAPQSQLRREVAGAVEAMPLPHRLGMLAVLDHPLEDRDGLILERPALSPMFATQLGPMRRWNKDIPLSEFAGAPANPFERAARLGNEITAVSNALNSEEPTLVTELRLGLMNRNLTYPTLRTHYLIYPEEGYKISEPEVTIEEITYVFPSHLRGREVYYDIETGKISPKSSVICEDSIEIPRIAQLRGSNHAGKLLFGVYAIDLFMSNATGGAKRQQQAPGPRMRDRRHRNRY